MNGTGGGRSTVVVTPSTMVMMEALETSHAAHGIPGAVDSNAKETFPTARKRPHLTSEVSLDEEAMLSNALINPRQQPQRVTRI